jgi:superfamily II DNA or RNA helicase
MHLPITPRDIQDFIDENYFARGLDYFLRNKVISCDVAKDGQQLIARVKGSGFKVYQTIVNLDFHHGELVDVRGQCSCPVGYNCKHVAAVLLSRAGEEISPDGATPATATQINTTQNTQNWLDSFKTNTRTKQQSPDELHYLLSISDDLKQARVIVQTYKTRALKKTTGWGKGQKINRVSDSMAGYLTDSDKRLNQLLEAIYPIDSYMAGNKNLYGEGSDYLLQRVIQTGRSHWQTLENPVLKIAEPRQGKLEWFMHNQQAQVTLTEPAGVVLLPVTPPWFLDPVAHEIGPLQLDIPPATSEVLLSAPPIPVNDCPPVIQALKQAFPDTALPLPKMDIRPAETQPEPVPYLRLYSEEGQKTYYYSGRDDWEDYAEFSVRYGDQAINPDDLQETLLIQRGNYYEEVQRQHKQEEAYFEELFAYGLQPNPFSTGRDTLKLIHLGEADGWVHFSMEAVPGLRQQGWQIDIDPSFRFQFVQPDEWYADLDDSSGEDWFNLELGIQIDGKPFNLLPTLVGFIQHQRQAKALDEFLQTDDVDQFVIRLEDGRLTHVPFGKVKHIINTLVELYDPNVLENDGSLKLSRYQASQLNSLDDTDLAWGGAEAPRQFAEKLANFEGIQKIPPPDTLKAELRPYQKQGLNWLQFLREYGLSGILADDMGLGKTVQTLAHLLVEKAANRNNLPSLVVAPTSLMVNWAREAERFAPELKVCTLQGHGRKQYFDKIKEYDLVLSTYPLLPRDSEVLLAQPWYLAVLDEAQHIKNPRSKVAETARKLNTQHRLCLTGTPIENHLGELWSQFHFLMPGLLGNEKQFRQLFRKPIENQGNPDRQKQLNQRIKPFMLRREKAQVVKELPEKTEIISTVELNGKQRQLYETVRVAMHEKVRKEIDKKGLERSQIIILDALLKLRQICCDPRLLKMDAAKKVKESAKLEQLMEMLPEMIDEGRRILLFSQFTSMLSLIEDELAKQKINYVKLTGQTKDRATPIDQFQQKQVPLFLISLKAGGAGLNLTAADTVIHYDPWWNPAAERQATDRAHRIGQENKVFVYKFITEGTVEEKIHNLQQKKQALADALFDEKKSSAKLSKDDLQALFEPLG